jgi:hypothetical protein
MTTPHELDAEPDGIHGQASRQTFDDRHQTRPV